MTGLWRALALSCLGAILGLAACGDDVGAGQDAASGDAAVTDGGLADSGVQMDAALAPDAGESEDGGTYVYTCTPIGASDSDGFFSLETFNNQVYAGQFGYGHEGQSMLYRYPAWGLVTPGLLGISESVCALQVFDGYLYANTESSGDIFRSADGANWELLYNGDNGSIGCGLAPLNNSLYAVNYGNAAQTHGRILRQDGTTWTVVYDSGSEPLYLREIVSYNGTLYAFGVLNQQGQMLTSTDGTTWTEQSVANRYFRGHVWNGYLWLGSSNSNALGEVAVWRFDGTQFLNVHPIPTRTHVTDLQDLDGRLFASTSNGWKDESGPSGLWMSPDGQTGWQRICEFWETAAWSMTVWDGALYVGTWDYGSHGSVYRVQRQLVQPVDCSLIPAANPAWEVCETGPAFCAGVFNDSAGCGPYCAAVGLPCTARFGGDTGCVLEPQNVLQCAENNGHASDWCECGTR